MMSREQRLITKEHIRSMHTNLILGFILQYFSDKSNIEPKFLLKRYRPVFFYMLRNPHGMLTFKTEVLHLISNVELVKRLYTV